MPPTTAPLLSLSRRFRRTPFSEGVEAAGVRAYTVYNHMLLPTMFRSIEEDYHHLKQAVQVWDVSVQRQVEGVPQSVGQLPVATIDGTIGTWMRPGKLFS